VQLIIFCIFFGTAIASAVLLLYALLSGKYGWAYLSAVFALPLCLYVAGYPATYYVPVLFPVAILLGAMFIKKQRPGWALLFFAPYLVLWLSIMVIAVFDLL